MKIKIKKLVKHATIPTYATQGDAGMDLYVAGVEYIDEDHVRYKFGIALEIPEGYVGMVFPRSSIYKQKQILTNCVGILDSGYRGEVMAVMLGTSSSSYTLGDRAAQLIIMPYPYIEFEEAEELSITERGVGGYGSTGNL